MTRRPILSRDRIERLLMALCLAILSLCAPLTAAGADDAWENQIARGRALMGQGRYKQARDLFEQLRRQVEPQGPNSVPDNPRLAVALNNLGAASIRLDDIPTAERCYRQSAAIWKQRGDIPNALAPLTNLAAVYLARRRYSAAEALLRDALDLATQKLGPDNADVAVILTYLADSAFRRGDYAAGASLGERALAIVQKSHGPADPDLAIALGNLGTMYRAEGRVEESSRLFTEAVGVLEKSGQRDHPAWIPALENYSGVFFDRRRYAEAEELLNSAIQLAEKILGPNHPKVARILSDRAVVLRKTGRKSEARKLEARAAKIEQQSSRANAVGYTVDLLSLSGSKQKS